MGLKDIAKITGVSISTVSRVLNNKNTKAASSQLQKKIWDAARETNYIPNKSARELRLNSNSDKSLNAVSNFSLFCLVTRPVDEVQSDPFFTRILTSIDCAAFASGNVVEYTFALKDIYNGTIEHKITDKKNSCLITVGRFDNTIIQSISKYFNHIVSITLNEMPLDHDQIICDGSIAAQKAVQYLYNLGHRKIGFIGEKNESRFKGYTIAMKLLDLPIESKNIIADASFTMESGISSLNKLLRNGGNPTAIFCANDRTAIGVLRACKDNNIKVPEDISVFVMNDIDTAQYISPMLTTIHVPCEELGKVAINILLERINNKYSLPLTISLPFYIVKRESTSSPKQIN